MNEWLQVGHVAVVPISSSVAETRWPQLGHANLNVMGVGAMGCGGSSVSSVAGMLRYRSKGPRLPGYRSSSVFGAMPKQNIIGPLVRRQRVGGDLSQDALAAKCQRLGWALTRSTLAKIEAGIRRVNDAEVFLLACALGGPVDSLFPAVRRGKPAADVIKAARHSAD